MGSADNRPGKSSGEAVSRAGELHRGRRFAGENKTRRDCGRPTPGCEGSAGCALRRKKQLVGNYFGRRQEPPDSAPPVGVRSGSPAADSGFYWFASTRRVEKGRRA